jgi:hypothetical protein
MALFTESCFCNYRTLFRLRLFIHESVRSIESLRESQQFTLEQALQKLVVFLGQFA